MVEHPVHNLSIKKLVKLKSSIVYKFSKTWFKFIIVIVKSKTEIIQYAKVRLKFIGKTFNWRIGKSISLNSCFLKCKMLSTTQTRLFLCTFSEEVYFWETNFKIYHIIFLVFLSTEAVTEVFCKKTVFKNFGIFTGKQLCETDSFFKKVGGLQPVTWWKAPALKNIHKQLLHQSDYFYVPLSLSWTYLSIIDMLILLLNLIPCVAEKRHIWKNHLTFSFVTL